MRSMVQLRAKLIQHNSVLSALKDAINLLIFISVLPGCITEKKEHCKKRVIFKTTKSLTTEGSMLQTVTELAWPAISKQQRCKKTGEITD